MFDTKIHCVIASTGCGKTIFLKDLLRRYVVEDNIFKFGFIFAANICHRTNDRLTSILKGSVNTTAVINHWLN